MKKLLIGLTVAVLMAIAIGGYFYPGAVPVLDKAFSGNDIYGDIVFNDKVATQEFTQGGGILSISTTSATYTLTQAELANANVIKIGPTAGAAAMTLTLPASTSFTTLLPKNGDTRDWIIWNAHTAAATTTTVAVGTGIDLQGDTTGDDVINGGVFGKLQCTRLGTTDPMMMCYVNEGVAAD